MKWKIATIVLTIALVFVGCSKGTNSTAANNSVEFDMKEISEDWIDDFYLYEDTETHIQYILYKVGDKAAITPRYFKHDGTLYSIRAEE